MIISSQLHAAVRSVLRAANMLYHYNR